MTFQTVSRVLMSERCADQNAMCLRWCELSASAGGSFSIETKYADNWYHTYIINWPTEAEAEAEAVAGMASPGAGK